MRRGYDRDGYLRKIEGLRRRIPGIALGTDIIVGFPEEGPDEFEETLGLLDEVGFDTVYSFTYSERPGTAALELGDPVPEAEKQRRLARLQSHQLEIQERRNRAWLGRQVEVLVEGRSKRIASRWTGRSPENRIVHFSGRTAPGRFERVRIRETSAFSLKADPPGLFCLESV
jgi:tRNA-2-methylthio-N6-dimethylallyladenosine synthase